MEQRDLWAEDGETVRVARGIRFDLGNDRFIELDPKTGALLDSDAQTPTATELMSAQLIQQDYKLNWAGFSYVIRSAMHKEVRRGDIALAVRWSRLLSLSLGEAKLRAYVKQILFEETRNLSLLATWKGARGFDATQMVRQITASVKKWELVEDRGGAFERYVAAYMRVLSMHGTPPTRDEMKAAAVTRDLDRLYEMFWRVQGANRPDVLSTFDAVLRRELTETEDDDCETLSNLWPSHFYTMKVGCEMLGGIWTKKANVLVRNPQEDAPILGGGIDVPKIETYAYDNHTRPGLVHYVKGLAKAVPGKPLPAGMDLRWSGMVRGACWREFAFAQHGANYVHTPWEDVEIPAEVWQAVVFTDGFFYSSLYRRAGIRGVPFPRG